MEQNSLTHWGIKGMKWGRRRFQNKDGSLTPAGKKRYQDLQDEMDKLNPKGDGYQFKKKSISDMSDEEIVNAINRARLEDAYRAMRPEPVNKGKQFAEKVLKEVIAPAATNAGKKWLENKLGDVLGLNKKELDEIAKLTKERDKAKLQKEIDDYKNPKEKELSWEEKIKKQTYEKNERDANKPKDEELENAKREAEFQKAKNEASKNKQEYDEREAKRNKNSTTANNEKTENKNSKDDDEPEVEKIKVTPDMIFGEGTSKGSQSKSESKSNRKFDDVIYDADWTDVTPSNVPAVYRNTGQSFISALLEDPKK